MTTIKDLRCRAENIGLVVQTSQSGRIHADDHGGYRLIYPPTNSVISGTCFDLDLAQLEVEIAYWEARK